MPRCLAATLRHCRDGQQRLSKRLLTSESTLAHVVYRSQAKLVFLYYVPW